MTESNIFCASKEYDDENSFQQKRFRAFNKEVGKERYEAIYQLIKYDILKDVTLNLDKNLWKDEWEKVTNEQWKRLSEIPEYDGDVVEMVVGFKPDITDDKTAEAIEVLKKAGYKIIKELR